MQRSRLAILALLALLSATIVLGQTGYDTGDLKLSDGRIIPAAKIIAIGDRGVTVAHGGRVEIVPVDSVPLDVVARAYQKISEQNSARNKTTAEIAERERQRASSRPPDLPKPRGLPQPALMATSNAAGSGLLENACVIASNAERTGTGFVLHVQGGYVLVSNQHVIDGGAPHKYEFLDRKILKPMAGRLTKDRDLVIFDLDGEFGDAFEMEPDLNSVALGEDVLIYGNSLGQGVRVSKAQLVAKGKTTIEVSGGIAPGNSGGPILRAKTRRVIGVSTYATVAGNRPRSVSEIVTAAALPKVRFFGVRIDGLDDVSAFDLPSFLGAHNALRDDSARLERAKSLLVLMHEKLGGRLNGDLASIARRADRGVIQTVDLLRWSGFTLGTINRIDLSAFRRSADSFFDPIARPKSFIHQDTWESLEALRAGYADIYREMLAKIPTS